MEKIILTAEGKKELEQRLNAIGYHINYARGDYKRN